MRFAAGLTLALLLAAGFAACADLVRLPGDADGLLVAFCGQVWFLFGTFFFRKKTTRKNLHVILISST